jgi:rRNA-processing protein FCF1
MVTGLLICGCIGSFLPNPARDAGLKDCEKRELKFRELCYINTATDLKDTSICELVKDSGHKQLCIGRVGVATNDPSLCEQITNISVRRECLLAIAQKYQ